MKIVGFETLHCDAGWRNFSFLKVTLDNGVVGWSEYQEGFGSPGVTTAIESLRQIVMGQDPRRIEAIYWDLYAATRPAAGGIAGEALGAIENALLDAKAKLYGVPVCDLLGGAIRDRLQLYWSHCGTWRVNWAEVHELPPVTSLDDVRALGREVRESGFGALKTNIFLFDREPISYAPGFNRPAGRPELNVDRGVIRGLIDELSAFRDGAGPEVEILLDLNFNFRTEGYLRLVEALAPLDLFWIELDTYNPEALALIRSRSTTTISSGETLFGIREFRPFFDRQAMDVAIIDAVWNGVWQSMKIANLAEAHEINVAPHNFYGHLSTMMNAHFVAAIPNFRIMEIDIDQVPWRDDLFTHVPQIEQGHLLLPDRPGWGTEPDERALEAHPARAANLNTSHFKSQD